MANLFDLDESFNEDIKKDFSAELKKARALCARGQFERALAIYEAILDEDVDNEGAYVGLLRVHSEDFTVYRGKEINQDIHAIEKLFPDIEDEEYISFMKEKRKFDKENPEQDQKKEAVQKEEPAPKKQSSGPVKELLDDNVLECVPWLNKEELINKINEDYNYANALPDKDWGMKGPNTFLKRINKNNMDSKELLDLLDGLEVGFAICVEGTKNCKSSGYFDLYVTYICYKHACNRENRAFNAFFLADFYFLDDEFDTDYSGLYVIAKDAEKTIGKKARLRIALQLIEYAYDYFYEKQNVSDYYRGYLKQVKSRLDTIKQLLKS